MKNEKLFHETIDILVKAYLNETLVHSNCAACAVGNIVAFRCGYALERSVFSNTLIWEHHFTRWDDVFMTAGGKQHFYPGCYAGEAKKQIDSTGYTWQDLARIENAFEMENYHQSDEDGYKGLMAVVDVLCEIHECEEIKEETKALFVK